MTESRPSETDGPTGEQPRRWSAGTVAVLSPHLDDAVLSLGAAVSAAARAGDAVAIVTVLAGDPSSTAPAGAWDAGCGFVTAADATRARRTEDREACRLLGAEAVWLPFADRQYGRAPDDEVWSALEAAIAGADTILVPGFPLAQPDHLWVAELVTTRQVRARVGLYVEQPYAIGKGAPSVPAPLAERLGDGRWTPLPAGEEDVRRKRLASRAYRSQLRYMAGRWPAEVVPWRIATYERRRGGEAVAWLPAPPRDPFLHQESTTTGRSGVRERPSLRRWRPPR